MDKGDPDRRVNLGHSTINLRSSDMETRFWGSHSKIRLRIELSSGDRGKIVLRNCGSLRKARKVESSVEALFQGFRPQDKLTKMTPRLHTSLGAEAYGRGVDCWHSASPSDQVKDRK